MNMAAHTAKGSLFVDSKGEIRAYWDIHVDDARLKKAIIRYVERRLPGSSEKRGWVLIKAGELLVTARNDSLTDVEWFIDLVDKEIDWTIEQL